MIAIILITASFGIARFFVPVSGKINNGDIFKDMAHIWVGILIGITIMDTRYWILPAGLTLLEVAAFVIRRK